MDGAVGVAMRDAGSQLGEDAERLDDGCTVGVGGVWEGARAIRDTSAGEGRSDSKIGQRWEGAAWR